MKRLLYLLLILFFSSAYCQKQDDYYNTHWLEVYRLELKSLPKSALEIVDQIYDHASKKNDKDQVIKALIYQSKFALALEEDAELKVVNRFKEVIAQSKGASRSILENYLAVMYFDYYENNSWQIHQRTKVANQSDNDDFRTWDAHALLSEINRLFLSSTNSFSIFKKVDLEDFHSIIFTQDSVDLYRPTLVDILAQQAIEFYKTGYSGYYIREAYPFTLNAEYLQNLETLDIPDLDSIPQLEALRLYQKLYHFHKNRNDINALVKVDLDRLEYVKASESGPEYLNALDRLVAIAKDHPASTLVLFEKATWHNENNNRPQAIEICNEAIANYPDSDGAEYCEKLKKQIEASDLNITTEKYLVPDKPFRLLVSYKGFSNLYLKVYRLTQAQSKQFNHSNDSTKRALIDQLPIHQQHNYQLIDHHDYNHHSTEVALSGLPQGAYLLVAATEEKLDDHVYAYSTIQVTNIALVSVRLNSHQMMRVQAIDRFTGAPLSDCRLSIHERSSYNNDQKLFDANVTTDQQGFACLDLPDHWINTKIDASYKNDSAAFENIYINRRYDYSSDQKEPVNASAFLFTDRSIYRPGQTLFFKGIVLKNSGEETSTLNNEYVKITLKDVNYKEVVTQRLKTNEYGSVSGELQIPTNELTGTYRLSLNRDTEIASEFYDNTMNRFDRGYQTINVEEYKRPTFEVTFDPIRESFKLNDSITATGKATTFSGAAISNAKVVFSVERT